MEEKENHVEGMKYMEREKLQKVSTKMISTSGTSRGKNVLGPASLTSVFLSHLPSADTSANALSSLFKHMWNPTTFHTANAPG